MLTLIVRLLSILPNTILYGLANGFALLAYYVVGYRKQVVSENLKRTFPEKEDVEIRKISIQFYRHFFQVWAETIIGASLTQSQWQSRIEYVGLEKIEKYLKANKSVIYMTGHSANWEWSGTGSKAFFEEKVTVFYKEVKNKAVEKEILALRKKGGLNLVPKDIALRYLIKTKNEAQVIGMISDQIPAIGSEKYWMEFLNQETAFYQGAEKFARAMKYPVFYADMRKTRPGYYRIEVKEVFDGVSEVEEGHVIKRFSEFLEETIKARPSDYLWSHRRWKYTKEKATEVTGRPYIFIS